jgi:hypothetical protein
MILRFQSITVWEVTNMYKSDALSAEFLPHTPDVYGSHHPDYPNEFHGMASRNC